MRKWIKLNTFLFASWHFQISQVSQPVQLRSRVWLFATPWTAACQASLSTINSRSPPKLMPTESVMPSNYLILCRPLLLLPSIFPSIRVFSNESALCIRWPKYWSFSFNISPTNEHPGLISFRMDLLDLLAVQGTLKSLFQHYSSKASILQRSAFFIVQISHPYMTTVKTIALTRWTFVDRVMSLLFNVLSRLVITFLPRSKCLLILWLQSPSAVILEPRKIKSATVSPTYLPWSDGTGCHDLSFLNVELQANFFTLLFHFHQEYKCTKLYKKVHDPDNHDGVITHLESDILECEVKWALGSIAMSKATGDDGIPVKLFQILKDDAVKVLHQYASKSGKLSSGHRTGKGQFSFQPQRREMSKNVQTTSLLHSSHTPAQ